MAYRACVRCDYDWSCTTTFADRSMGCTESRADSVRLCRASTLCLVGDGHCQAKNEVRGSKGFKTQTRIAGPVTVAAMPSKTAPRYPA